MELTPAYSQPIARNIKKLRSVPRPFTFGLSPDEGTQSILSRLEETSNNYQFVTPAQAGVQ